MVNLFYPIYNGKKVSLQCLEPTAVVVDGENMHCDDVSLQFIPFPQAITVNGKTILSVHLPQHFSMKISKMTDDFEIMSKFQPLNDTSPGLVQEVVSYFQVAQTIHWSLLTLVLFSIICIVLLICFCAYLKCPHILSKICTCCCETSCCFVKCLSERIQHREIIRTNMSTETQEQSVQMINMGNPQPQPQIENAVLNQSQSVFLPSAPNVSSDTAMLYNMSRDSNIVPPLATSDAHQSFIQPTNQTFCKFGYNSCFCLNGNRLCSGPIRQPPFQ